MKTVWSSETRDFGREFAICGRRNDTRAAIVFHSWYKRNRIERTNAISRAKKQINEWLDTEDPVCMFAEMALAGNEIGAEALGL